MNVHRDTHTHMQVSLQAGILAPALLPRRNAGPFVAGPFVAGKEASDGTCPFQL